MKRVTSLEQVTDPEEKDMEGRQALVNRAKCVKTDQSIQTNASNIDSKHKQGQELLLTPLSSVWRPDMGTSTKTLLPLVGFYQPHSHFYSPLNSPTVSLLISAT